MSSSAAPFAQADRANQSTSRESRSADALLQPVDISFLVYFRIVFGLFMLWHVGGYLHSGAVENYFIKPAFHFTYPGFGWVRPWPGVGMYLHFFVMGLLAVFLILGFCYRFSALLFFLAFTYTFLLEKALFQNHYYLICLLSFLMVFLPAHRAASLDAVNRPRLRASFVPAWTLWLLRFQLAVPYFYGGIAKLNHDWLHGEPMRMGLHLRSHYPVVGPYFTEEWVVWFFAYGGIAFDLLVVPALLWRPTRVPAYLATVAFHLINSQMFHIGIFPWFMIAATAVFFRPDWPRRLLALPTPDPPSETALPLTPGQKLVVSCVSVWVVVQVLLPFRLHLYPGDPSWTEYGQRFAWRMMLRAKDCPVRFLVSDPRTGRTGTVDLRPYLMRLQLEKIGREPDMLVEFSHFLAEELERQGQGRVEVRALVLTSLNGRKPQLFIDPRVDLAAEPRRWGTAYPWVMPLVEPLRASPWDVPILEWENHVELDPDRVWERAREQNNPNPKRERGNP